MLSAAAASASLPEFSLCQRSFVGVDAFSVYQEVLLQPEAPRVCNLVEFGRFGYLRVRVGGRLDAFGVPAYLLHSCP